MNAVASPSAFLDDDELRTLTGCSMKRQQIETLRAQRVPFFVNRAGKPVVVRAIIEGRSVSAEKPETWIPRVVNGSKTK